MNLDIRGLASRSGLFEHVTDRVTALLSRPPGSATSARITFVDDNGPKGGVDRRCALTVRLPRWPDLHVEHVSETARSAFDGALTGLERQVERQVRRGRDNRRHPKKYFVARRLLGTGRPRSRTRRSVSTAG
jgi:ribosome hibernation promoting factor